ncbi:protein kinase family protein [Nocardioides sp.]|uniref:protein kinase family protein n=1 Tax=Nocardioides sp. TaxID=35761 RepID=UPI003528D89B
MPTSIRPGDVLAGRYRLEDLLNESRGGRFWRAHDRVLDRHVAVHCLASDDERAPELLDAARRSAAVHDRCILRVLDADQRDDVVFVVNEWGDGASLDIVLQGDGPLEPRHAAWVASEVGASLAVAHESGVAHGRLNPENVLLDHNGHVRLIGLGVEAALWGLPQGRMSVDVVDLAAILYAGLTGRWAGISASVVPPAPAEHGSVLRPRQVRAGIPRPLDRLCDEVINPDSQVGAHAREAYDLTTARGIADYLRAFVGDGADLPSQTARQVRRLRQDPLLAAGLAGAAGASGSVGDPGSLADDDTTEHDPVRDPAGEGSADQPPRTERCRTERVPDGTVPDGSMAETGADPQATQAMSAVAAAALAGEGAAADAARARRGVAPRTSRRPCPGPTDTGGGSTGPGLSGRAMTGRDRRAPGVDQPTELGMPIFGDGSDDVEWLTARASKPPPPPPFEDRPERPLFAPDPAPGEPVRRPRPGAPTPSAEYWPWDQGAGTATGTGTGAPVTTGSGIYYLEEELPDDGVPGRSWLRLGMVILAALLLVLAVLVGLNLFRGRAPLALGPSESSSTSPSASGSAATGAALTGLTASDLDPQGNPPEENSALAKFAVDGDPRTDWHTVTYKQNLGPGGLKTGVGLVVDVGEVRTLDSVSVQLVGAPTGVTVFLSDDRPRFVKGLTEVTSTTDEGDRLDVPLEGASARYVVIWLTSLPEVDGGFRGTIAEVGVTG